ncbi:MAG: glucosamine-6-phosphate deaminase [Acidobacteriaceae bacterium]|nr:glucosamine-6-phosphate deaminase [Acidobacteriaceae bacterium]
MVTIFPTSQEMAQAAAEHAADSLRNGLRDQEIVRILAATGASQIDFLHRLTAARDIDWPRVELFHLDEYVGLGAGHPASFARYIRERIIDRTGIARFHLLDGTRPPAQVLTAINPEIRRARIDLAFVGIGENGHLAFNDPPADFEADEPYLLVNLDQACRQQQVKEGWFVALDDVPKQAISISIQQLLKTREILCIVPDKRKAAAVKACLEGPLSPEAPASALRVHPKTSIFLDAESASLLSRDADEPLS